MVAPAVDNILVVAVVAQVVDNTHTVAVVDMAAHNNSDRSYSSSVGNMGSMGHSAPAVVGSLLLVPTHIQYSVVEILLVEDMHTRHIVAAVVADNMVHWRSYIDKGPLRSRQRTLHQQLRPAPFRCPELVLLYNTLFAARFPPTKFDRKFNSSFTYIIFD